MEITELAQIVLFGHTLADKLVKMEEPASLLTDLNGVKPIQVPKYPNRPLEISLHINKKKARFPNLKQIQKDSTRGEVLHFFANHELLAMELMALLLLRFPEAPKEFRLGVARTLREEQSHMSLYLSRMKELGVSFGDLPVSGYFWRAMSPMKSPMEFVTQMSLTFEQANLDFSLFYKKELTKIGDQKTAEILDRVYREEIGHVKHGLKWFNLWRDNPATETDWDAYRRLLPAPLTPRRAKGDTFDEQARREAGLSETFIEELKIYSGAKGRPPVLWLYNPFCEAEIARGSTGHSPKAHLTRLAQDLEHLPIFTAHPQDAVLVQSRPRSPWINTLLEAGFEIPECLEQKHGDIKEPKFGGFQPWGWSPETFEIFKKLASRLAKTSGGNAEFCQHLLTQKSYESSNFSKIFSKSWGSDFFARWLANNPKSASRFDCQKALGQNFKEIENAKAFALKQLELGRPICAKAPLGTSGNGVKRILSPKELNHNLGVWMQNTLADQKNLLIEPWLDKVHDLSFQFEVTSEDIRFFEVRKFLIGKQNQYQGTCLGHWKHFFDLPSMQLFQELLPDWKLLIKDLGQELQQIGYQGPVGMDAMIYRNEENQLRLKPWVELNPRWTMGRVALELEKHLDPSVEAAWLFFSKAVILAKGYANLQDFWTAVSSRYPLKKVSAQLSPNKTLLREGVLATQDPLAASEVLTLLAIGKPALHDLMKELSFE